MESAGDREVSGIAVADRSIISSKHRRQLTADSGQAPVLGEFKSRVLGVGPQIGFIFRVGDMQGYLNLKGYKEFAAENRPEGWNAWITLSISQAAAPPPPQSTLIHK
jgi:Putative MetA-pathway of phenol degradation